MDKRIQPEKPAPRYRNQAAGRVLTVLSAFAQTPPHARGVTELARALGMNKNMVHRALTTLAAEGLLTRDTNGQLYRLSPHLFDLAPAAGAPSSSASSFDIVTAARPALERLHALTGESVFLSIAVGRHRVTVDDILAQGPRVLRSTRGHPVPLHCTKMSRVLLAHFADAEIAAYLAAAEPLARAMPVPDPPSETRAGIMADIRDILPRPYIVWRNPHSAAATYVIFPIRDGEGGAHAILTIGGPRERFDVPRIEAQLPAMRAILAPLQDEARLHPAPAFMPEPASS